MKENDYYPEKSKTRLETFKYTCYFYGIFLLTLLGIGLVHWLNLL